jgi:hypothetical protein
LQESDLEAAETGSPADTVRFTATPVMTPRASKAALKALDAELNDAEDALQKELENSAGDDAAAADPMRFATVSAGARAAQKAQLKTVTELASSQVEKAQQMMAVVNHNKARA